MSKKRSWFMIVFFLIIMSLFMLEVKAAELVSSAAYTEMVQQSHPPNTMNMAADLLFARPLLIGATAVGIAFFVVSLPFTVLGQNTEQAAHELVVKPTRAAFFRCLGCRHSN